MVHLLEPHEIDLIEREHARGLPAPMVVELFRSRGVRFSGATFRKYVQVGLLPRSRRVGRKGKHRGSHGLYPVGVVRRINVIKKMMVEGLTLEEIRRSFVYFRNEIEELERVLGEILAEYEKEIGGGAWSREARRDLERAVFDARREGKRLVQRIERIASRLVAGPSGPGSKAEDAPRALLAEPAEASGLRGITCSLGGRTGL